MSFSNTTVVREKWFWEKLAFPVSVLLSVPLGTARSGVGLRRPATSQGATLSASYSGPIPLGVPTSSGIGRFHIPVKELKRQGTPSPSTPPTPRWEGRSLELEPLSIVVVTPKRVPDSCGRAG